MDGRMHKRIAPIRNDEKAECRAYFRWCCLITDVKDLIWHNVNEGKRSNITGKGLKLIGMRSGVLDYHLPMGNGKYCSLALEMKLPGDREKVMRNKTSETIKKQKEWIKKLNEAGNYATLAFGWEDAVRITQDYLANRI